MLARTWGHTAYGQAGASLEPSQTLFQVTDSQYRASAIQHTAHLVHSIHSFVHSFIHSASMYGAPGSTRPGYNREQNTTALRPHGDYTVVGGNQTCPLIQNLSEGQYGPRRRHFLALRVLLVQQTCDPSGEGSVRGQPQFTAWRSSWAPRLRTGRDLGRQQLIQSLSHSCHLSQVSQQAPSSGPPPQVREGSFSESPSH